MFSAIPYALQNSAHSAALFRQASSSLVPAGGGVVTAGDLTVTQTGTPSMNVSVGVGRCWIPGTNVGNVTGGNFSSQAMYYGQNESSYTAAVTTADSVNPRIDVVYASVQDSQYAGTTNAGVIAVAAGVPTSGATYPANAPTLPANSIALAWINVPATATSIINSNITQLATKGFPTASQVYANTATVGSSTNLLTGLTNHAIQPIIQTGTYVGTTTANGDLTITYPATFPNGVISAVGFSGDGVYVVSATPSSVAAPTTSSLFLRFANPGGSVVASTQVRGTWIAYGW